MADWTEVAPRRKRVNTFIVFGVTSGMTLLMFQFISLYGLPEWATLTFLAAYAFFTLFTVSNFLVVIYGFVSSMRGVDKDPYHPVHKAKDMPPDRRIAVLYPIYEEDMRRVGAGLGATWEDLERNYPELSGHFDFFVLSDSRNVDNVVQEEAVTHALAERYPNGRFHYRRRGINLNAKQGNIADFCRRWGNHYTHMVVMDADSIMTGESLVRMARIMEGNPRIGILQSKPSMALRKTLFARMSQFTDSVMSKLFAYGQNHILLGHAYYVGHNAMLRVAVFREHCALPVLSGERPWGGKPLSHDYVEASLMVGSGYEVWMLPDVGSYEEFPPNIIDSLKREQRWMHGSMQYLRVILSDRVTGTHKYILMNGVVAYMAPLFGWALFFFTAVGMAYFLSHPAVMFKALHFASSVDVSAIWLLAVTVSIFVGPYVLSIITWVAENRSRDFGGVIKMLWSSVLSFFFGLLYGPVFMAYMTYFLFKWAKGQKIKWGSQSRSDRSVTWRESFESFWWISLFGVVSWAVLFYFLNHVNTHGLLTLLQLKKYNLVWWYVPILSGLTLAVWTVRFTSLEHPYFERFGWFLTPDEIQPSPVLARTNALQDWLAGKVPATYGFADAITDPWFFHRHLHLTRENGRPKERIWAALERTTLDGLSDREKIAVLSERALFSEAHWRQWGVGDRGGS